MEKAENQTILEVSGQYGLGLRFRIKMVELLHRLKVQIVHVMQRDRSIIGMLRKVKKEGVWGYLQRQMEEEARWHMLAETKPIPEEWLEFFGLTRHQLDKDLVVVS